MKTIIAGSRSIQKLEHIELAIKRSGFQITEVVSGSARGVDRLGERWAKTNSVPIKIFSPDWDKFGKAAGMIRNAEMARYAEALIAIWDGSSRGTKNMIEEARKYSLKVYIYTP